MAAALLIVEALKKTDGNTEPKALIKAMEGLRFDTAKGQRTIRAEDHQAMQEMYTCHLEMKPGSELPVPILDKVISAEDSAPHNGQEGEGQLRSSFHSSENGEGR